MIERTEKDGVTVLRLAHGRANAIDLELLAEIERTVGELSRHGTGGLVLTGAGRMFSAGVDLHRVVQGGAAYLERFLPALDRALEALFTIPRPVVAAINGHAIAGGLILACACDQRIAAAGSGRLGVPELRVGVPFPALPLEILRSVVPPHRLQELVLLGRTYEVEAAAGMGLVDEVVAAEALESRAVAVARELAAIPAAAFAIAKQQLRRQSLRRVRQLGDLEASVREVWSAEATHGWIADYLARTLGKGA